MSAHIAASDSFNRNELGHDQADAAEFFYQPAKRRIGDAGHRRKREVWSDLDTSYVELTGHNEAKSLAHAASSRNHIEQLIDEPLSFVLDLAFVLR